MSYGLVGGEKTNGEPGGHYSHLLALVSDLPLKCSRPIAALTDSYFLSCVGCEASSVTDAKLGSWDLRTVRIWNAFPKLA